MVVSIVYVHDEPEFEQRILSRYRPQIDAGELACEFVRSGAEALARVDDRTEPYALIVVDTAMPGMSGLELLDALAAREIETPVLIISDQGDIANFRAAMSRGAFDFLPKPVDLDDLEVTQHKALRHFQTLRRARIVDRAYGRPELAALGLLIAGLAHDLRNPLGFVSSFTNLALELLGELGEEVGARCEPALANELQAQLDSVAETLDKVRAHSNLALQLVGSVLDGAGRAGPFELNTALVHYVGLYESSLRGAATIPRLVIHRHFDEAIGSVALESRDVLSIVINLLENAAHALRERAAAELDFVPEIWVETRALEGAVELSVSDNGPGVPAELRELVFQPFFTTKAPGEGTGLGLHLVERLATKAGGGVVLEARVPAGACFRVRFAQ
jgi:two-component system NtrC family sensor kinase